VENPVPVVLKHLGVRVETRVAKLSDLLSEEFDTVGRVAEDDGLVDLELMRVKSCSSRLANYNDNTTPDANSP
jgi:hypothetical protein